jgi:NAD(P)-dependent dehydrogenase (short-subunit alcohol dehydrogenase family)
MEVRETNRVLVVGAQGAMGTLTVRAFQRAGWAVRAAARRPTPGQVHLDLGRPESVAAALEEHELVVNTVPDPEVRAERHVLEHGGALINVSALPAAVGRSLRAVAGGARGTVVMNAGLAPGVTTIVAADLLRQRPAADELDIVYTFSLATPRGPASVDFIHRGLTALVRHRTALVSLPWPFGERRCLGFGEGDAGWLGGIAEGRIVRQYVCVAEPAVHEQLLELNDAGTMDQLPRSLLASPDPSVKQVAGKEPVAHWIAAIRGGRRLEARTVQCRGDFVHAAESVVVFAEALLAQPRQRGCFQPEETSTLSGIEAQLEAAGIAVVAHTGPAIEASTVIPGR